MPLVWVVGMGLDAVVYCDCFERRRLRAPPPTGCSLSVAADGSLLCGSDDLDVQLAFDQWQLSRACEHEMGVLLHRYIGNIALVAALRGELQQEPDLFPLLLSKVLYNGVHSGDFIPLADLERLQPEVAALGELPCTDPEMAGLLVNFAAQMKDLVACGLRVGKPIAF